MAFHVPFDRQVTVKSETRRRQFGCWEWVISKVKFSSTLEDREEDGAYSGAIDKSDGPGEVSEIVIKNVREGEPDHHLGLQLQTLSSQNQSESKFYRHILEFINPDGPGKDMKIKEGDEMLMLNSKFLPTVAHQDVMNQLYNLKVDGQSTIELTIRRQKRFGKWKWLDLFAIPCPCRGIDCDTTVRNPSSIRVKKNRKEVVSDHVYKVPGTQRCLKIDNNGLRADTLTGDSEDETKIIERRTLIYQRGARPLYEVALCDKALRRYVTFCPENTTIILAAKPQFFKYSQLGDKTHFMNNDGHYLGFDHESNEVKPQRAKFAFEEGPVPDYLTIPQAQLL